MPDQLTHHNLEKYACMLPPEYLKGAADAVDEVKASVKLFSDPDIMHPFPDTQKEFDRVWDLALLAEKHITIGLSMLGEHTGTITRARGKTGTWMADLCKARAARPCLRLIRPACHSA